MRPSPKVLLTNPVRRSGSTRETSFFCRCETSRMIRQMLLSSTQRMRLVAVCSYHFRIPEPKITHYHSNAHSEVVWRAARKRQDQRDRDLRRWGGRMHIRVRRRRGSRYRRYLNDAYDSSVALIHGSGTFPPFSSEFYIVRLILHIFLHPDVWCIFPFSLSVSRLFSVLFSIVMIIMFFFALISIHIHWCKLEPYFYSIKQQNFWKLSTS